MPYGDLKTPTTLFHSSAEMQEMSTLLSNDARQFAVSARDLYHQALFRKYLPWIVIIGIILLVFILRVWLY